MKNDVVHFYGSASSDALSDVKNYSWDFGDGHFGLGVNPAHAYKQVFP
jgi:PKD repeat protein